MPYKDPEKQKQYQREWVAARRAEWLAAHGPCAVCGSDDRMEIDHVDPTKKISHKVFSWSEERRDAELAKCQVLCYEHHKQKTIASLPQTDHGRGRMYQLGCRCGPCREWKRDDNAKRIR